MLKGFVTVAAGPWPFAWHVPACVVYERVQADTRGMG